MSENKLLDILTDHVQIINELPHISGSLVDHVYIKKSLMEEFFTNVTVESIYFSNHDAVRIIIEKILWIFKLFHKIQYDEAKKEE